MDLLPKRKELKPIKNTKIKVLMKRKDQDGDEMSRCELENPRTGTIVAMKVKP